MVRFKGQIRLRLKQIRKLVMKGLLVIGMIENDGDATVVDNINQIGLRMGFMNHV